MAIKIKFDASNNPESPTLILAKKSGDKLGVIPAREIDVSDSLNDTSEISFKVYKTEDGIEYDLWDELTDFKLVYCVEWNRWFEMTVELDETIESIKTVFCTDLGRAELSQIMLYDIEINTEEDIARDDYVIPTVLYDPEHPESSLLHRIMGKASHYYIKHVDDSIKNIQRMFSFDETSLYDAFMDIADEIDCLFVFDVESDTNGAIQRAISVYDLESRCLDCDYRGKFTDKCPKCGSENINEGYGDDTTIFIAPDDLADGVELTTDTDAVKNYFKLEAGDDLMTATIRNCNPNGTDYIWYITDDMKHDMSDELVDKLNEYDEQYAYYQNEYVVLADDNDVLTKYNALVDKYQVYNEDLTKVTVPIKGYSSLMNAYYNTIDLQLYLTSGLMPSVEMEDTDAQKEAAKLTSAALSPVGVEKISNLSQATADGAVLGMAKILVDSSKYKVVVKESALEDDMGTVGGIEVPIKVWTGTFTLTNYSDEEDTADSVQVTVEINDDYETFVKQKIDKQLAKVDVDNLSIEGLFDLDLDEFKAELKKYCLNRLTSFHDACQTCIEILIEQGIADGGSWIDKSVNLYEKLYVPYLQKAEALNDEMKVREDEIAVITGTTDEDGNVIIQGLQSFLFDKQNEIKNALDFEKFIGKYWNEFCAFRREDKYSNDNYISDGLNNTELFERAREFIDVANEEIYKSAELQRSISTTLKNLLVIDKFKPLLDDFAVGNWIRVMVDDVVYKLRLIQYEINYDELDEISVEFSDVTKLKNSLSDIESILDQASSMATSYDTIKRQAKNGSESKDKIDDWVNNGLYLTNSKIVGNADNQNISWDSHGILLREYLPELDEYDDRQAKIINRGIYFTTDNWETARAGVGNFNFYNPKTREYEDAYGVIADKLVGNLILGKNVGIYNTKNSMTMDENGFSIITNAGDGETQMAFNIQNKSTNDDGEEVFSNLMYVDSNGNLVLNGTVRINTMYDNDGMSIDELVDPNRLNDVINGAIQDNNVVINDTINNRYNQSISIMESQLNDYKAEVGQYLQFNENGLTIGAQGSPFSTVIDNRGMYFMNENTIVSYVNNNQLYIPHAVINNSMFIGNFFFSPHADGSVSISWHERAEGQGV